MKLIKAILAGLAAVLIIPDCPAVQRGNITIKQFKVTAYCPCRNCCGKSDGITASGYKVKRGDKLIAADRSIPFGTILDVPGYGRAPVLDRGGKVKGDHIDVFFPNHQMAEQWGTRILKVAIYGD